MERLISGYTSGNTWIVDQFCYGGVKYSRNIIYSGGRLFSQHSKVYYAQRIDYQGFKSPYIISEAEFNHNYILFIDPLAKELF